MIKNIETAVVLNYCYRQKQQKEKYKDTFSENKLKSKFKNYGVITHIDSGMTKVGLSLLKENAPDLYAKFINTIISQSKKQIKKELTPIISQLAKFKRHMDNQEYSILLSYRQNAETNIYEVDWDFHGDFPEDKFSSFAIEKSVIHCLKPEYQRIATLARIITTASGCSRKRIKTVTGKTLEESLDNALEIYALKEQLSLMPSGAF